MSLGILIGAGIVAGGMAIGLPWYGQLIAVLLLTGVFSCAEDY